MSEESQHVESGEVVDLRICNAVSRGMSMKEARETFGPKIAAEKQEREAAAESASEPQDAAELKAALTAAGVEFHPNAKEAKLRKLWESHKEAGKPAAE